MGEGAVENTEVRQAQNPALSTSSETQPTCATNCHACIAVLWDIISGGAVESTEASPALSPLIFYAASLRKCHRRYGR